MRREEEEEGMEWTGLDRTGQDRTGQDRTGQDRKRGGMDERKKRRELEEVDEMKTSRGR